MSIPNALYFSFSLMVMEGYSRDLSISSGEQEPERESETPAKRNKRNQ